MDEEYKHKYKQKAASQQSLLFLKVISLILFDSLLGQWWLYNMSLQYILAEIKCNSFVQLHDQKGDDSKVLHSCLLYYLHSERQK